MLVGEHDLPENDVRQDLVLKHRNKRKKGNIDDELDNLLLRGRSQLSHVSLDVCAAGGGGSDGEVLEHLRRRPAGKGSGSQGGDDVGEGRRQVSKAGLRPEPRGDRSDVLLWRPRHAKLVLKLAVQVAKAMVTAKHNGAEGRPPATPMGGMLMFDLRRSDPKWRCPQLQIFMVVDLGSVVGHRDATFEG